MILAGLLLGVSSMEQPVNLVFMIPALWVVGGLNLRWTLAISFVAGALLWKAPQLPPVQPASTGRLSGVVSAVFNGRLALVALNSSPVMVRMDRAEPLAVGDEVALEGSFLPRQLNRLSQFRASSVEVVTTKPSRTWSESLREKLTQTDREAMGAREAALVSAVCLSSPGEMDKAEADSLASSGLRFLVTGAGLHVLLAALALQALLGRSPLPRALQMVTLIAVLACYVQVSGYQVSVIRAAIAAVLVRSACLFRREPDAVSAIAFAGGAILLFEPEEAFSVGFQMTLAATLFLALFARGLNGLPKAPWPRFRAVLMRTFQFAAIGTLATAPLVLQRGHSVALEAILAAPAAGSVLPAMLALGLAGHGVAFVWRYGGLWILGNLAAPLAGWFEAVTDTASRLSWLHVQMPPFSGYWLVPFYACALMLWRPHVRRA